MAWHMMDNFFYLSLFFVLAMLIKRTVPHLQRFIIPNAILAGFIGLVLGPSLLNLIPLQLERLGDIIYHLMAVGFIGLSLKKVNTDRSRNSANAGFVIVSAYLVQGIFGFLLTLCWNAFDKGVSPLMGLFLPLGYGQGPGQAFSLGSQWEELGMSNGAAIGLTVAAAGFVWATIGGIIVLNFVLKRDNGFERNPIMEKAEVVVKDFEFPSMDGATIQIVFIGAIYFGVYALLTGITRLLSPLGDFGRTLATMLWGFHFVFGALAGLTVRHIYNGLLRRGIVREDYLNNFLLQRISGGVFDFMVAAAISAVSFARVSDVFIPLLTLTLLGGVLTYAYLSFVVPKAFPENSKTNLIAMFGMLTGTISTGIALLREVDPGMETGAADNLVLGSGVAIGLGLPLMVLLNVPVMAFISGQYSYNLVFLALMIVYGLLMGLLWAKKLVPEPHEGEISSST